MRTRSIIRACYRHAIRGDGNGELTLDGIFDRRSRVAADDGKSIAAWRIRGDFVTHVSSGAIGVLS